MAKVRNNFKVLLAQKEIDEGREITYQDINNATGIATSTLTSLAKNRTNRFDGKVLIKLCDYFGCSIADLLEYPPETGQEGNGTQMRPEMTAELA